MQWLIDLIIDAIGIPPVSIDRGDPPVCDFSWPGLLDDGLWHELDLSGIVPAGASLVGLYTFSSNAYASKHCAFRTPGNVNTENISMTNTQVSGVPQTLDVFVNVDANRKIEYKLDVGGWTGFVVTVKNWWL